MGIPSITFLRCLNITNVKPFEREALLQELIQLKHLHQQILTEYAVEAPVTQRSSNKDKVNLFRGLFKGLDDVYPRRWENSSGKVVVNIQRKTACKLAVDIISISPRL